MITIFGDYGFDIHKIEISESDYEIIQSGQLLKVDGQGFIHETDGIVLDHWVFNEKPEEIYFWLDNGAQFYIEINEIDISS